MGIRSLPFEISEYNDRLARVRASMADANLDALLVTDPSNMCWLTGYDGWSFYVHQGVIVTHDADPLWWGRAQDVAGAQRTIWMSEDRAVGYAENFIQTTRRHPMEDITRYLKGRVGVEMDNYYYSAKAHVVLGDAGLSLVDATGLVNWCRAVKSETEISFLRNAARISEAVVDGMVERIEPCVPKNEVIAEAYRDAIRGVDGNWGDYPAIVPLVPSGADAAAPHLTWDGRPFARGEATTIEIAGCYRR